MKKTHIGFDCYLKTLKELSQEQRILTQAAADACDRSYSPYSHFAVGAAAELDNGEVMTACNQENAAYPSGLCAERTLLFYVKAKYPNAIIRRMAIAAKNNGTPAVAPISPCGACRQVILETVERQHDSMELIMAGSKECIVIEDVRQLLPLTFTAESMQ